MAEDEETTEVPAIASCGCPPDYCDREDGARYIDASSCRRVLEERTAERQVEEMQKRKEAGRLGRDELFMAVAELYAQRSTCLRGHTAAVIVRGRHQIGVGYNGAPPGLPHCTEVGCEPDRAAVEKSISRMRSYMPPPSEHAVQSEAVARALDELGCQRAIHAELNAIAHAARYGISTHGCTMYSLSAPCLKCAQAIISAGISALIWKNPYRADRLDLLEEAGVNVMQMVGSDGG